ncbi:hypothetical protein BH09VER1_BH09VER1_11040 [soil metagenome]
MRSFFLFLSFIAVTCLPGLSPAEQKIALTSEPLSLQAAQNEALRNNPSIKAALSRWAAMKTRVAQESAWSDARVSFDTKAARFVDIAPNAFMDQAVSVEQIIPVSGKNLVRARIAAAEALASFEDVRRRQLAVVTEVRTAYARLANGYAQLELNQANLASLQQAAKAIRSGYEAGTRTASESLMADTDASRLEEAQDDITRRIADEKSRLNVLLNRDAFLPLITAAANQTKPADLSLPQLRSLMQGQRPEIRSALAQIEAERQRVQLARREWIPDPAISVQGQRYNDSNQALSEIDTGVSFSIPWGNPKKYSAHTQEAKNNLAARQAELDQAQKESLGLLREQLQKIETTHHHLILYQGDILSQAQKNLEVSQAAYETGQSTFSEWITAQRLLREVQASALDQRTEYEISLAELEAIVGAKLPTTPGKN